MYTPPRVSGALSVRAERSGCTDLGGIRVSVHAVGRMAMYANSTVSALNFVENFGRLRCFLF